MDTEYLLYFHLHIAFELIGYGGEFLEQEKCRLEGKATMRITSNEPRIMCGFIGAKESPVVRDHDYGREFVYPAMEYLLRSVVEAGPITNAPKITLQVRVKKT